MVLNHATTDPDLWANNLFKMLKVRFTQHSRLRLDKYLNEIGSLKVKPSDTAVTFVDRYKSLVTSISAIDKRELPTETQRMSTLKNSVREAFPLLWAIFNSKSNWTEQEMVDQINSWLLPNELRGSADSNSTVANYLNFDNRLKKAAGKKF